jgi:hypothetical protein
MFNVYFYQLKVHYLNYNFNTVKYYKNKNRQLKYLFIIYNNMENNQIFNYQLKLKLTTDYYNINSLLIKLKKPLFKFKKKDILLQLLVDDYQLIKFDLIMKLKEDYIDNFNSNKKISKYDIIKINYNNVVIDKYILFPIVKYYKYNILSYLFFYYFLIKNDLPNKNSNLITIIKIIGPWEIKNNKLELYFELEDFLIYENNVKSENIKTVFIYIDYGVDKNIPTEYNIKSDNLHNNFKIYDINNVNELEINNYMNNSSNILIDSIKLYDNISCNNEIASLPLMIYIYNLALKSLIINGNLYIFIGSFYLLYPSIELFYFIFSLFKKIDVLDNKMSIDKIGYFKYSNYINPNNLDIIINKYKKYDKYIGQHLLLKLNPDYCIPKLINKRIPNTNHLIKSIFTRKSNIDYYFIQFINDIYYKKNKIIKEHLIKIKNIKNVIEKNIHSILSDNISKCIEFCKFYKIDINNDYEKFKPINYKKIIQTYFIKKQNINYNYIKLAIDSIFSITKPNLTIKISNFIKKYLPSIDYIIDGTSNVGTTCIVFSYYFKYIYAVEINENTFTCLTNNVNIYNRKNIKLINDDTIKLINNKDKLIEINFNIDTYCLFLDPPWGGYHYKLNKNLNLFLSDIDILDLILNSNIKYIVVKVPFNYNFKKLYKYFSNIIIHKLEGFYIIIIIK